MFSSGPKYQKLTTNLRLAINRLKLLEKKKTEMAVKARREIADYLIAGKEDRARIRVEHIIREDYIVEAMELIEMYCDLLLARMGLIQSTKEMDEGLEEPISSIIWATPRLQSEVQELVVVSEQLALKYGREFAQSCRANALQIVNEKLIHKLNVQAPPRRLVERYMVEIAKTYNVAYTPPPDDGSEADAVDLLLIDPPFSATNDKKGGGGGGSGGGRQVGESTGWTYCQSNQPNSQPAPVMPAQPQLPPYHVSGSPFPVSGAPYPAQSAPPVASNNYWVPPSSGAARAAQQYDTIPELPAVPTSSFPPSASAKAGGDDVDFDDLSKRFEELKKRK
jgi:vacuolar protein sorting-associated protein IST1